MKKDLTTHRIKSWNSAAAAVMLKPPLSVTMQTRVLQRFSLVSMVRIDARSHVLIASVDSVNRQHNHNSILHNMKRPTLPTVHVYQFYTRVNRRVQLCKNWSYLNYVIDLDVNIITRCEKYAAILLSDFLQLVICCLALWCTDQWFFFY